jgi:hypothetical protein
MNGKVLWPDSCQKRLRETIKHITQDKEYPGQDLNTAFRKKIRGITVLSQLD